MSSATRSASATMRPRSAAMSVSLRCGSIYTVSSRIAASPRRSARTDAPYPSQSEVEPVASVEGVAFRVGQRVRHERFGTGRVRRLESHGASIRATVEFRSGVKTLDLDFARLEPVREGA